MSSSLPVGWDKISFDELCATIVTGRRPKGGVRGIESGVLSLGGEHIHERGFIDISTPRFVPEEFTQNITKAQILPNDILIVKDGATTGKTAIADDRFAEIVAYVNEHVFLCRSVNEIEPRYLFYFLRSDDGNQSIMSDFRGAAQGGISRAFSEKIDIPVPPLSEQQRIVAKLDALFARTRQAREELEHIPALIDHYKQAILAAAFRGELTADWRASNQCDVIENETLLFQVDNQREELWHNLSERDLTRGKYKPALEIDWKPDINLPADWIWVSVDQLVALTQYGTSSKTTEEDIGIPVLRMGNIQDGRLDLSSLKFLPEDHDEFPNLLLDEGDILFNRTNSAELVGKSAVMTVMDRKISFASYLIRMKASGMDPSLLVYYINSPFGRDWVASVVTQQVGQANVNGTKLRELGVPLMSPEEQFEICTRLDMAFAWLDTVLDEATSALRLLDHLDQATLAKAFRGELVPQDLEDEPASVLLERICAARAERTNGSRRQKRK